MAGQQTLMSFCFHQNKRLRVRFSLRSQLWFQGSAFAPLLRYVQRCALFDPGKTSRINVGHFIATLIDDHTLWNEWKGQMPVIYNKE